ncbi:hypothetical protein ACVWW7_007269 [Bradyrhizobium sp. LM6.9]
MYPRPETGFEEIAILAKSLADGRNMNLKRVVFDGQARPDAPDQIVLRDEEARRTDQFLENFECAAADWHRDVVVSQLSSLAIDQPMSERVSAISRR